MVFILFCTKVHQNITYRKIFDTEIEISYFYFRSCLNLVTPLPSTGLLRSPSFFPLKKQFFSDVNTYEPKLEKKCFFPLKKQYFSNVNTYEPKVKEKC